MNRAIGDCSSSLLPRERCYLPRHSRPSPAIRSNACSPPRACQSLAGSDRTSNDNSLSDEEVEVAERVIQFEGAVPRLVPLLASPNKPLAKLASTSLANASHIDGSSSRRSLRDSIVGSGWLPGCSARCRETLLRAKRLASFPGVEACAAKPGSVRRRSLWAGLALHRRGCAMQAWLSAGHPLESGIRARRDETGDHLVHRPTVDGDCT